MRYKKRQNSNSLPAILLIFSTALICSTIIARDVYPRIIRYIRQNRAAGGRQYKQYIEKKEPREQYVVNITPELSKMFRVILHFRPGETKTILAIEITGFYDITFSGLDLVGNKFQPERSPSEYIMELTMFYINSFHQWNFTRRADLEFRGVFLVAGSRLKLRYEAPRIHTGCIGINLKGGMYR